MSDLTEEQKSDLKQEKEGNMKAITIVMAVLFVIFILVLWFSVYFVRQKLIDKQVNSMQTAEGVETTVAVDSEIDHVRVVLGENTYSLYEFAELNSDETIVNVLVYYDDGNIVEKQAYISYSEDTEDAEYIDSSYGRIIFPQKYNN